MNRPGFVFGSRMEVRASKLEPIRETSESNWASLNSMGPVLVHVITKEDYEVEDNGTSKTLEECHEGFFTGEWFPISSRPQTYSDLFAKIYFDVGMAEQHAVTFLVGQSCGGLKPFCIIPASFLQRAYDQVVHDVDRQKIPVRFALTIAGLVGSDGATYSGAFDISFMSCLPNMIVMAPSDEASLFVW